MDTFQPSLLSSRLPMPLSPSDEVGGVGAGGVSDKHLSNRSVGGPRQDFAVELGGGRGRQGLAALDRLSAVEGPGLYKADGRVVRAGEQAEPGSEARLRSALQDLGLSPDEIDDFVHVSRMLARISPDAARRLEEGLRAMAETSQRVDGDTRSPMERLEGRNGYALDYIKLEFSYTHVSETLVDNGDGTVTREVSSQQIDLSFERLEVAFRGRADDAPAFLKLDGDDLSFGADAPALTEALPETDVEAVGLRALLDALSEFRLDWDDDEDRFGLRRLGHPPTEDAGDDAAPAGRKTAELLFS